jgi:hypothetical protein
MEIPSSREGWSNDLCQAVPWEVNQCRYVKPLSTSCRSW